MACIKSDWSIDSFELLALNKKSFTSRDEEEVKGYADLINLVFDDYNEIPVSIDEFLENPEYLGKVFNNGASIYPFWRDTLHMIFHDNPDHAHEIALTGAIGLGKSTIAAIAMMYQMYRVLCLKDPQKYYHLTNNAPIVFVCQFDFVF